MNGLTHNTHGADRRHTRPMTDGILAYSQMAANHMDLQQQQQQQQQKPRKSHKSKSKPSATHHEDAASMISQASTISQIKSRLEKFRSRDSSKKSSSKRSSSRSQADRRDDETRQSMLRSQRTFGIWARH